MNECGTDDEERERDDDPTADTRSFNERFTRRRNLFEHVHSQATRSQGATRPLQFPLLVSGTAAFAVNSYALK